MGCSQQQQQQQPLLPMQDPWGVGFLASRGCASSEANALPVPHGPGPVCVSNPERLDTGGVRRRLGSPSMRVSEWLGVRWAGTAALPHGVLLLHRIGKRMQ